MTPVDIIVVSYNTRHDLHRCLASLRTHPPARPHHVCVVDNQSSDGSVEMVRDRFPDVQVVVMQGNAGFAAANNAGIRATRSPLILLLNPDAEVTPHAVDVLITRLETTGAAAAGPRIVDRDGRPEMSWGPMLRPWTEAVQALRVRASSSDHPMARAWLRHLTARERRVDWVTGACLLVRREAALAAGLLDERYFMYEEDVDFCAALRAGGGTVIFTPAATVVHARGRATGASTRSALYDRSHVAFYEKHAPRWLPLLRWWKRGR